VPAIFHIHAFFFFGWLVLYLTQTSLIAGGNVALHRRLGWLTLGWVPAMVVLGTTMTIASVRNFGGPAFFDANEFLFQNIVGIFVFAGMVGAAIVVRRRTDWHRRLMYCAMASITGPGLGRILPMPLFIPWAWWVVQGVAGLFMVVAMILDRRRTGRIHPAWLWGIGIFFGSQIACDLVAYSPWGLSITHDVLGPSNSRTDLHAHFPHG
jgi:hypothetical protein